MGKYMKKGKITGDVAVMEIPQSTSLGVRTRARTLALQPNPELSYLQLRSRRLEKPPFQPAQTQSQQQQVNPKQSSCKQGNRNLESQRSGSGVRVASVRSGSTGSVSVSRSVKREGRFGQFDKVVLVGRCDDGGGGGETEDFHDLGGVEPSFGENNLDFDARESRSTRESTPCSFIRGAETIGTPGSTTRRTCSNAANRRAQNMQRAAPTTPEMEEFFSDFELHQQKLFIEKYNYDIINDLPLPGRYEWVRVDN